MTCQAVSHLQRASLCQLVNQVSSRWFPKLSTPMGSTNTHVLHNLAEQGAGQEDKGAEGTPGVDRHNGLGTLIF